MTTRKPRPLRADERALWQKVMENTVPLHPDRQTHPAPPPKKKPVAVARFMPPSLRPFQVGEASPPAQPVYKAAPAIAEQISRAPLAMDHKTFGKLKKGRLSPEARIDLHGMTTAVAHGALTRFIKDHARQGRRLVLVITGKGRTRDDIGPIPVRHGVLRHQVPHWLNTAPLKAHVLQITEAHVRHGGQGAYYVYLRRNRA